MESLLKRRNIRDFLKMHNEAHWKSLIINTLDYGIQALSANYNLPALSAEDIKNIAVEKKRTVQTKKNTTGEIRRKPSSEWRTGISKSKTTRDLKGTNDYPYAVSNEDFDHGDYHSNYSNKRGNDMNIRTINQGYYSEDFNTDNFRPNEENPFQDNYNKSYNKPIVQNLQSTQHKNYQNNSRDYSSGSAGSMNKYHRVDAHPHVSSRHNNLRQNYQIETAQERYNPTYSRMQTKKRAKSVGMQYNIYPEWWGCADEDSYEEENTRNHSVSRIMNKGYQENLNLREKQAIIKRARQDSCSSGGVINYNYRDRSAEVNTRDRIYDRVQKPIVSIN